VISRKLLSGKQTWPKIFIAFDVNVLNYKDNRNIERDHVYNSIKLRKLEMICVDNV
jgi:hypothetical protein